ncbi:MAG TPA: hypothetical protein VN132_15030 [Bdellovibrio sp.]|nr:hypothetical protein [Bdellovibrio sp.]
MRELNVNKGVEANEVGDETATSVESYLTSLANTLAEARGPASHKSYHEMADMPVLEADVLGQLHTNIVLLEDLQNRLSFVMKEIRYQMKI